MVPREARALHTSDSRDGDLAPRLGSPLVQARRRRAERADASPGFRGVSPGRLAHHYMIAGTHAGSPGHRARIRSPEKGTNLSDSNPASDGSTADSGVRSEGPTNWQARYDGLQRLLGQRTNDLTEARRIAEGATARAEQAERLAREYQDLATALASPSDPYSPPARPPDVAPDEPRIDANQPRKTVPSGPSDSITDLEREAGDQLASYLANRF